MSQLHYNTGPRFTASSFLCVNVFMTDLHPVNVDEMT